MNTCFAVMLASLLWLPCASSVETVWTYASPAGYVDASPALGDLTGDGRQEIVVGTTGGMVIALTAAGEELWRYEMRGPICVSPSIGDVNEYEGLEVVAVNRQGQLKCLSGPSGALLWEASLPGRLQWGETALALGDATGDGSLDIVTGDSQGNVVCFNGAGETVWTYVGDHGTTQAPALADVTGDGALETLVGGNLTPLLCLSSEGKELWRLEGALGGSPVVYDLNGDGSPEILVGVNESLTVVDKTGAPKWTHVMQREMDGALSVADADEDGEVEIYAIDLAGHMACLSPEGVLRWSASVEERARRSPAIGDVDGDGKQDIVVAGYSGALHIFEPDGRLKERIPVSGGVNATATLVPLPDGGPGILVPAANEAMRMLRLPGARVDAVLLWPEYRFDAKRAGNPQSATSVSPVSLDMDFGPGYVGANFMTASVSNPEERALEMRLEFSREGSAPSLSVLRTADKAATHRISYTVPFNQAVNLNLTCTVLEEGRILARRGHTRHLVPFMQELGDAERLLSKVDALLPTLPDSSGLEERAALLQMRLASMRPRILAAGALNDAERVELRNALHDLLKAVNPLHAAAAAAAERGALVFACAANPWAPFGGLDELQEGRIGDEALAVEAFDGETESAALNVFNLSGKHRVFRVVLDNLVSGEKNASAREAVVLHEVAAIPTEMRDFSADALPRLNGGQLIHVPAWEGRQLWFTIDASRLGPGEWSGAVRLDSLDVDPVSSKTPLNIQVWTPRLPEKQALSLCHWGYVHSSMLKEFPEEALADQVRNGTNVFVGLFYPKAHYDEAGNLVGEIDFAEHDAYVKRHAPHGKILFFSYQRALQGPGGLESEAYAKAHVAWLRAWTARLRELGVGYDGFALYPVDEPGLSDGLVEQHILMARLAREADPNILLYTDPVGRITEEELRRMLPYVDIWCPNRNGLILDQANAAKLEIIQNAGKTVWMYECDHNAKHQSPLGYYRAQAWLAWRFNMTGIGFWSYCTSQDDPWFRPAQRHDYLLVYPGDGVVSSKRWEAVRDGVEDYAMLSALRAAIAAPSANADDADLAAAKSLLEEEAHRIAAFCGLDDDGTVPGAEGLPGMRRIADDRWEALRQARREIAALLTRLQ